MTAAPADIQRFTNDGVVLISRDTAIRDAYPGAVDGGSDEIVLFFDAAADGQVILEERFALLSMITRPHEAVETDDGLDLGRSITVVPRIPHFFLIDPSRALAARTALRAYSFDHNSDRYALELAGTPVPDTGDGPTMDSTLVSMDDTGYTADET